MSEVKILTYTPIETRHDPACGCIEEEILIEGALCFSHMQPTGEADLFIDFGGELPEVSDLHFCFNSTADLHGKISEFIKSMARVSLMYPTEGDKP